MREVEYKRSTAPPEFSVSVSNRSDRSDRSNKSSRKNGRLRFTGKYEIRESVLY